MAEQQRKASDRPAAERYYAEYVRLSTTEDPGAAVLQEAINEKAKRSWTLVSTANAPSSDGLLLVWVTPGFFSG
jgi:hypothetical protein